MVRLARPRAGLQKLSLFLFAFLVVVLASAAAPAASRSPQQKKQAVADALAKSDKAARAAYGTPAEHTVKPHPRDVWKSKVVDTRETTNKMFTGSDPSTNNAHQIIKVVPNEPAADSGSADSDSDSDSAEPAKAYDDGLGGTGGCFGKGGDYSCSDAGTRPGDFDAHRAVDDMVDGVVRGSTAGSENPNDPDDADDADDADGGKRRKSGEYKNAAEAAMDKRGIMSLNKNAIRKYDIGPTDMDPNAREHRIKRRQEEGTKASTEALIKTRQEARLKMTTAWNTDMRSEAKAKTNEDILRQRTEEFQKSAQEQEAKASEATTKKLTEVQVQAETKRNRLRRDESAIKEEQRVKRENHAAVMKLTNEKAKEEREKILTTARDTATEQKLKAANSERLNKDMLRHKRVRENTRKLHSESRRKAKQHVARREQRLKRRLAERRAKRRRSKAMRWCRCRSVRRRMSASNRWYQCPGHTWLAGIHRTRTDNLSGVSHFRCCGACRRTGRRWTSARRGRCVTANWVRSFDRRGGSVCPHNTYMVGMYRSGCPWIYCIEYARCCSISGSRGNKRCGKANWWRSLDRAGWSFAHGHNFIRGFYRTSRHRLHNIEEAYNCQVFAH